MFGRVASAKSPTFNAAMASPAAALEASGVDVEPTFGQATEGHEDVPGDLSKDDKAMILMEMGLRIMSADPRGGLLGAIGQAGLGTMGSWRDIRASRAKSARDAYEFEALRGDKSEERKARAEAASAKEEAADRRHGEALASRERIAAAREAGLTARGAAGGTGAGKPTNLQRRSSFLRRWAGRWTGRCNGPRPVRLRVTILTLSAANSYSPTWARTTTPIRKRR
jgi:hypothetical protein